MNLKHTGTTEIFTERLTLRRFRENDANSMFQNWASDPEVTKYVTWGAHTNINQTKQIISIWIKNYSYQDNYQWAMEITKTGDLIGSIGLFFVDDWNMSCEIGYCMGQNFWGHGFATEACKSVIAYCFDVVGFNRISACCTYWNKRSIRVIEKCNMRYEGFARQKYRHPDRFQDCNCYGLLKRDYEKIKLSVKGF